MPELQQVETRGGVAYATHDGVTLLGDLYLPAGPGPFPALVGVHGGGWQAGARNAFQFFGPYLAQRGYALFAITYRLAKKGQKMFPQAVNDVLGAVQFVRGSSGQIKVATAVVGVVQKVLVKTNDKVFAGEALIQLADEELRARLAAAETQTALRERARDEKSATGSARTRRKARWSARRI